MQNPQPSNLKSKNQPIDKKDPILTLLTYTVSILSLYEPTFLEMGTLKRTALRLMGYSEYSS